MRLTQDCYGMFSPIVKCNFSSHFVINKKQYLGLFPVRTTVLSYSGLSRTRCPNVVLSFILFYATCWPNNHIMCAGIMSVNPELV